MALDEIGVDAASFSPDRSAAVKLTSSSTPITVCSRRALDVLDRAVDLGGETGNRYHRVVGELELEPFGAHQRHILLDQARLGVE